MAISTYRRAEFLDELHDALLDQDLDRDRFEVVVVDNGSDDETWEVLTGLAPRTPLALAALRSDRNRAPAGGRNLAISSVRAPLVAFTDDDCLPEPQWLGSLLAAFDQADVVQGRTRPVDAPPGSAWDRSVWVEERSGLFETCNLAYRRHHLEAVGGFDASTAVVGHRSARPFGEDTELGWRIEEAGGRYAFVPEAVVRHRWLPGTHRSWLVERRQLANFPALVRARPELARRLTARVFLSPRTASFDVAVVGTVLAVLTRHRWLVAVAAPWGARRWRDAAQLTGRPTPVRLAQLAVGDMVSLAALLEGSVRHRRLVL